MNGKGEVRENHSPTPPLPTHTCTHAHTHTPAPHHTHTSTNTGPHPPAKRGMIASVRMFSAGLASVEATLTSKSAGWKMEKMSLGRGVWARGESEGGAGHCYA